METLLSHNWRTIYSYSNSSPGQQLVGSRFLLQPVSYTPKYSTNHSPETGVWKSSIWTIISQNQVCYCRAGMKAFTPSSFPGLDLENPGLWDPSDDIDHRLKYQLHSVAFGSMSPLQSCCLCLQPCLVPCPLHLSWALPMHCWAAGCCGLLSLGVKSSCWKVYCVTDMTVFVRLNNKLMTTYLSFEKRQTRVNVGMLSWLFSQVLSGTLEVGIWLMLTTK